MKLQHSSEEILNKLISLLDSMNQHQYGTSVDVLSENSIGAHVRHIIEFYQCLLEGLAMGEINYDLRQRNQLIETDMDFAKKLLQTITQKINNIESDNILKININLSTDNSPISINTTFYRELAYNIEHAIHHMAIIRIGLKTIYPSLAIGDDFGLAYSTINYNNLTKK